MDACAIVYIITRFFFSYFDSLGIVLSRGYGEYIFTGNVSLDEGRSKALVNLFDFLKRTTLFSLSFSSFFVLQVFMT